MFPISWASNRIKRVVRSTLAAETLALNDGCDTAFFVSKLSCSILSSVGIELKIVAVTDNQSAVDAIHSSLISDRRLHVEMSALCQYQASSQVDFQHVKGTHQLSDVLTKRGASNNLLLATLQRGVLLQC